jgi:hypothetical protein
MFGYVLPLIPRSQDSRSRGHPQTYPVAAATVAADLAGMDRRHRPRAEGRAATTTLTVVTELIVAAGGGCALA